MKVLVVVFTLAAAVSAMPYVEPRYKFYEPQVMKYYGEPEEFISRVDKPAMYYAPGGYRLLTAGQYDLPWDNNKIESISKGYDHLSSSVGYPQFNWHDVPSHYYNYLGYHK